MTRLRFLFEEEEEKEEKPGWEQRTRGIGELPKYEIHESTKLKFTGDLSAATAGISPIRVEAGVSLPKPEEKPKPLFQDPKMIEFQKINFKSMQLWFKGLKESKDKWAFLRGEGQPPELEELHRQRSELAPYMNEKSKQWIQTTALAAYAVGLAGELIPLVAKATPEMLRKILSKTKIKDIGRKELHTALYNVTKGTDTTRQREIYEEFIRAKEIGVPFAERLKGVKITTITPRFAFGTKLYAGLPADEIAKSIVEVGKVTADMVKGLDPVKVSQVTQVLLNTSPVLASEFLKAVEKPEEILKVKPEVPIKPPIKPVEEKIEEKGRIIPEILKARIKAPIVPEIAEKEIIPTTIEEAKEILKVDVKKPSIPKEKLAEIMVEKKVSLADIEAVKGEKINVKEPKDIFIALRDIKAVEKEAVVEPTPKIIPAIPKELEPITEKPAVVEAPVAEKVITAPAKEIIPKVELATPKQIQEADIFAKEHKLITKTPSGKMSDLRYKRLAKNMTGKTSVKNMTREEADEFIESIKGIVQRRPWEPPIIPLSTKIVPKEFFEIEFKEPGLAKIITPKKYYLRILGAEPLLKDLIDSKELLTLKIGEINKWVNDVIKKINKEATIVHKFKARVFNRPTDKVTTMRDLLDKYGDPPDYLKPKEKEIFKEIRDFTKDILIKTNEVRDRVGLEPIKEIKTYIPHFLDELAKQIVNKKYPFPEDVKYWLGRNMPKKVYNPTAMERRVRDDLEKFFSKDLGALLRTLAKYDLRDIYLSEPYSILRVELNALGDKIPASTRKEIDLFLRHDIFNYPTELDQMLNKTLEKPTDIINFFLKPFNRIISNPISSLSNVYRQGLMGGAIAMKVRLVLRNLLTQKLLNINIYPIKDYLKAQFWLTPKGVMDEIRDTTFYKLSIRKFEDLPPLLKPVQWGMYPYSKSHAGINYISNVDVSGKVGYYYGEDMIDWCETPEGKAYIEKYAKKHNLTGKAKDDLSWRKGDEKDEAVEAMSVTQWLYFSTDMPRVFRGKGARAFWSLQSWWMNWFGKHLREGLIRMGGKTSRGRIVRPGDRINFIKGLLVILGLTEAIKRKTGIDMRRFLFFPFPTYIYPPAMQLMLNTYYLITANTDQKRKSAINGLKNNIKLLIPFSGAWKRYWQFIKGEITLKEWLFYMEKEEKKQPPLKITIPKEGKLKFTEPKLDIKSTKLKFTF